ncbi:alpha/beta hydrolase [Nocardioides zeae]|uniref:Alpha/beta hydrolase n=1 Tax=Nocardioides imazamoxiresistens TaxID=3231893 RepID=A0ABU3PVA6_9ACTN|nr:alpha/beta hydrolase [Nocardioides zeae]MDT9593170.1 alpha/beta hydrolase [Nocardioides zeae]
MRPDDRLRLRLGQLLAPLTVRYGEGLRFAGSELPQPERLRVPTRHGRVPVHVYASPAGPTGARGAYVHLHGGAFLMRHARMDDWWCRFVAARAGVTVVNVDFAVAPRAAYPVAQEQCHDVAAWVADGGLADRAVARDRVAVGGFSSGGGLAASVCLQARDRGSFSPALQVLGVPALDIAGDPDPGPGMISADLRAFVRRAYFPDEARRAEAYASPLRAESVEGLAPAVVLTAERDTLRREGDAYAARLDAAGLLRWHDTTPGVDHYFLTEDPTRARATMERTAGLIAAATA